MKEQKAKSKTIWRVNTEDEEYTSERHTFLLSGKNAAAVEPRALRLHKQKIDAADSRPYIRNIELVGGLDD